MKVIKRDGTIVKFDQNKIIDAVLAAFKDIDGEISDYALIKAGNIADYIQDIAEEKDLTVEEIQDIVEKGLQSTKRKDVAKQFIIYRYNRTKERQRKHHMIKEVGEKLEANNIQNQNANVDEASFGGRKGEAANTLMKEYALDYLISDMARENHKENMIYIHDLDSYAVGMHNCLSIPFDDLLANGFNTRQTDVRPANSVNTAFQLVAVIFQLQSLQQFGGVSATHIDWTMVPYVRKSFYKHFTDGMKYVEQIEFIGIDSKPENTSIDYEFYKEWKLAYNYAITMTKREIKQAVEGMYHNLNTLQSRSGNQLPFTSINYGTCTLPEGQMITEALIKGSIKGVGKFHKTSIFPCGIFQCMKGINRKPGEPNYYLYKMALESTSKRLYPNYANVDWSGNEGYDRNDPCTYFSTMGCRTSNGFDINGLGQQKDGRGNIAPVTIILPKLAMMSKEWVDTQGIEHIPPRYKDEGIQQAYIDSFMDLLDDKIHEARDMLIERFEYICSQPAESAKFMYENNLIAGYDPEEGVYSALRHGTLAVG